MKNKNNINKRNSRSHELKFLVEKLKQTPTTQNKDIMIANT